MSDCVPVSFGWHVAEWANRLQKSLFQCCWNKRKFKCLCVLSVAWWPLTMKCICFALIFPINAKHEFLHSEVLYLGHREVERMDADQMLFQILSKELDNRSLGNCTAWVHLMHWLAHQSSKDQWPEQTSVIDSGYHYFIIAGLLLEVKDVDNRTLLKGVYEIV